MLDCIKNNAFRIVGTSVNAKARERIANISKIKAYLRVNKPISFPLDMSQNLGDPVRVLSTIDNVASNLAFPQEYLKNSLFWIYTLTDKQKEAAELIGNKNIKAAKEIYASESDFASLISLATIAFSQKNNIQALKTLNILVDNDEARNGYISYLAEENPQIVLDKEQLKSVIVENLLGSIPANELIKIYAGLNKAKKNPLNQEMIELVQEKNADIIAKRITKMLKNIEQKYPEGSPDSFKYCVESFPALTNELRFLGKSLGDLSARYRNAADDIGETVLTITAAFINNEDFSYSEWNRAVSLLTKVKSMVFSEQLKNHCEKALDTLSGF